MSRSLPVAGRQLGWASTEQLHHVSFGGVDDASGAGRPTVGRSERLCHRREHERGFRRECWAGTKRWGHSVALVTHQRHDAVSWLRMRLSATQPAASVRH